jgi:putative DNA primase/helicase
VEREDEQRKGKKWGDFPCTDAGNAEVFAALYGKCLRYDHQRKCWLIWSQHWWVEDKSGAVMQFAKNAVRYRLKAAAEIEGEEQCKKEARWAVASESRSRLEAMLKLAQSESPLADTGKNWDCDQWLLGVANGVIDLRTGKLRPGRREDRITMHTLVPFDPEAKCPGWLKFLDDALGSNPELIDYVHCCVGYSLTGLIREQCIFYLQGSGGNGKSTFLETMRYVFASYAGAAPFSMLEHKNKASIPSDVASTAGKRLITASETDESIRLNESRIKSMTGGDKQTARFMYKDWFEYEATAKIWLAFNHKPEIRDDSYGMWRRVRLIPFNRKFDGGKEDKTLKEKLQAEAPGILAWVVRGCLEWGKRGLDPPRAVVEATEEYRKESDSLGNFIEDCCVVGENLSISSVELWTEYERWAGEAGGTKLARPIFGKRLASRNFIPKKEGHARTRIWVGISLKDKNVGNESPSLQGQTDGVSNGDVSLDPLSAYKGILIP